MANQLCRAFVVCKHSSFGRHARILSGVLTLMFKHPTGCLLRPQNDGGTRTSQELQGPSQVTSVCLVTPCICSQTRVAVPDEWPVLVVHCSAQQATVSPAELPFLTPPQLDAIHAAHCAVRKTLMQNPSLWPTQLPCDASNFSNMLIFWFSVIMKLCVPL